MDRELLCLQISWLVLIRKCKTFQWDSSYTMSFHSSAFAKTLRTKGVHLHNKGYILRLWYKIIKREQMHITWVGTGHGSAVLQECPPWSFRWDSRCCYTVFCVSPSFWYEPRWAEEYYFLLRSLVFVISLDSQTESVGREKSTNASCIMAVKSGISRGIFFCLWVEFERQLKQHLPVPLQ